MKNSFYKTKYSIVLILAILFAGGFYLSKKNSITKKLVIPGRPLFKQQNNVGTLTLRKQNDRQIVAEKEKFDLVLSGKSEKILVGGYDAVVKFDPNIVSFETNKSLNNRFDVVATRRDGEVIVTGTIKDDGKAIAIDATPLTILTFSALKEGNANIFVEKDLQNKQRDSNIINPKGVDILDSVENPTVFVGKKITATSKDVKVNDTAIVINSVELPSAGCSDCVTIVNAQITKGAETERLKFTTGGIAGKPQTPTEAFGVLYEIGNVTNTGVEVYFAPKQ
ncbi:hypothetical protein A2690_04470 [Candidatus Roizmanbacteria bacterium RIFCSPHIGHO2_01_FULL_39_12b]|uniref:Cohesin domain-containing protein n=1 Tax=Candidatus Roizmanbacteria bacterium RIFCSPHIGHO2_01_FULL_39_12b TaxID=1802030 RepID=A0A1F7GAF7_9BACT|nr:MAG: hypothetical protein A2690_04470 [Candidatus Roizmanbacteria bacterium RIFCSPHIGHO2_01_FULL_39_12b]